MKHGILDLNELDHAYNVVVQLRHQTSGVFHQVTLRPDKVKKTSLRCSMGHFHAGEIIMLGETPGDQAAGWQAPENVLVLAILGIATPSENPNQKWDVTPLKEDFAA